MIETLECDWWKLYKTDKSVKQHLRETFPNKSPLREQKHLENIKSGYQLVMFNLILQYPRSCDKFLPLFLPSTKTMKLAEMRLVHL